MKVGFTGQLVVSDFANRILVFPAGANGNVAPTQDISGSNTGLTGLDDPALDASGNIYVTDFNATGVEEFASTANGNVAPIAHITGPSTTFLEPEGVAVAAPSSNLTVTTSTSGQLSLGESSTDTATLSGGNSPTGSLVFNLYGPGDPSCTGAPAFTSAPITVSGNGNYQSPSFAPTAAGSYSWVAEYSGDVNNAPQTTACSDPAEQVSVSTTDPAITATGSSITATEGQPFSGTFTVAGSHTYGEEASLPVKVTITDNDGSGNKATASGSAKIADAALAATGVSASHTGNRATGTVARFTDSDSHGALADYSASISWGDGATTAGTVVSTPSGFAVTGSHTYAKSGTYKVTTTIRDVGGSMVTVSSPAVAAARVLAEARPCRPPRHAWRERSWRRCEASRSRR